MTAAAIDDGPRRLQLGPVKAFCDSRETANRFDSIRVSTMSPAMALSGNVNVEAIDRRIPPETADGIYDALNRAAHRAFTVLSKAGLSGEARLAAVRLQCENRLVLEAAMLRSEDFTEPRIVTRLATGNPRLDSQVNGRWDDLLASNPQLTVEISRVAPTRERDHFGGETVPLLQRALVASRNRILLPLILKLAATLPREVAGQRIGVLSSSELVDDVVVHLALRGYLPQPVSASLPKHFEIIETDLPALSLVDEIVHAWQRALASYVAAPALEVLSRIKSRQLRRDFAAYSAASRYWADAANRPSVAAVLASHLSTAEQFAYVDALAEAGVPVFAAQHGVGREIEACQANRSSVLESTATRRVLTFNEASADVTQRNPFARQSAMATACGLSSTHAAAMRFAGWRRSNRAIFVSTFLYRGYLQNRPQFCPDVDRAGIELRLVREALSDLPFTVSFKPYPAIRYVDPDPVLAAVAEAPGLELTGAHGDLRYLIGRYRLVISGGATSTIGWCVASRLPFVFLEHSALGRLSEAARKHFEAGSFYFDLERPHAYEDLRRFLCRPMTQIERDWRAKSEGRAQLSAFLGADRRDCGPAGARAVLDAVLRRERRAATAPGAVETSV